MGALPDGSLLVARRLALFSCWLYAAPEYLLREGEPLQLDDLHQHQAIRLLTRTGEPDVWHLHRGDEHWRGIPQGHLAATHRNY